MARYRLILLIALHCHLLAAIGGCAAPPTEPRMPLTPSPLATQTFADLRELLGRTERMSAFAFDPPCFECRVLELRTADLLPRIRPRLLDARQVEKVKTLLTREELLELGVAKPCPSVLADWGLVFHLRDRDAILLIYPGCMTARLVLEQEIKSYLFNVDRIYANLMRLTEASP